MRLNKIVPKNYERIRRKHKRHHFPITNQSIVTHSLVGIVCLYIGLLVGTGRRFEMVMKDSLAPVKRQLRQQQDLVAKVMERVSDGGQEKEASKEIQSITQHRDRPFPDTSRNFISDYATISRDAFNKLIDIGVPLDDTTPDANDVLVMYTSEAGLPTGMDARHDKVGIDATKALENCHEVKVILQGLANAKKDHNQCFAIVPQWESYSVHKWMRMPPKGSPKNITGASLTFPLQNVPSIRQPTDTGSFTGVPWDKQTAESNVLLVNYLKNRDRVLIDLKRFLRNNVMKHAKDPSLKTLVVLTSNKGQSEMFRNFVCNARAKGLDLSHVVMFATDKATAQLSRELGIHVWHDVELFGSLPEEAADEYGDNIFSRMMMAKIYCVNLALTTGYNILFQDVDIVWHRNPLPFLLSKQFEQWDMVFQDDGGRSPRYRPYSPNSGFYFVRNTPKTVYLFETFVRMGDMIQLMKSHQRVLNDLIIHFTTTKGLRVKVIKKGDDNVFPGGVEFHNKKQLMKEIIRGTRKPYIFHMSWTRNKENKQKFLEQLGEWYVQDKKNCKGLSCCLAQPNVQCHYRDKPSKVPCLDRPSIDGKNVSFW